MSARVFVPGAIGVLVMSAALAAYFHARPAPQGNSTAGGEAPNERATQAAPQPPSGRREPPLPPEQAPIYFDDATVRSGVRFQHTSGMSEHRYQPEADGSGAAVFDFDGDGRLDLFFATCVPFPLDAARTTPHHALYRHGPDDSFEDVSQPAGVGIASFGQGLAAGDYDNDGFADLYLTNYGPNRLVHNNGDGTFAAVPGEATSSAERWGAGCAFFDVDEDGSLDLYVANYAQWTVATHPFCGYEPRGIRTYCHPGAFKPDSHVLWRNAGDGSFTDATRAAGIYREDGRGFGVVATDVNDDGHIDLFVANDMTGNFLFLGHGDGTFDDVSSFCGAALAGDGQARASMGADATDLDGDGLPELFTTNFWLEPNSLFRNLGRGQFIDMSDLSGLGSPSRLAMGWGAGLVDFDNDGWADVLVSNGHIDNNLHERQMAVPYEQPAQLWLNRTGLRFELVSDHAGPYFAEPHVGRAIAFGDLNDDGRLDFVANHLNGPAAVLVNRTRTENRGVRFDLLGTTSNRDAVGTIVDVAVGALRIRRQMKGGASYLSAHDARLLIGVGASDRIDRVTIRWPSGRATVLEDLSTNRSHRVRERE